MTDKQTDWAEEIVEQLICSARVDTDRGDRSHERVAAALRKAKADGIRQAIAYLEKDSKGDVFQYLYQQADAIEKGQS